MYMISVFIVGLIPFSVFPSHSGFSPGESISKQIKVCMYLAGFVARVVAEVCIGRGVCGRGGAGDK